MRCLLAGIKQGAFDLAKLTTAHRIVIGFAIAPLALMGMAFYALHDLATLKEQSVVIVKQDWPKIDPIMVIATGVRDNARNTRDLLIDKDNQQVQQSIDEVDRNLSCDEGRRGLRPSPRIATTSQIPLFRWPATGKRCQTRAAPGKGLRG